MSAARLFLIVLVLLVGLGAAATSPRLLGAVCSSERVADIEDVDDELDEDATHASLARQAARDDRAATLLARRDHERASTPTRTRPPLAAAGPLPLDPPRRL